jgi:hypothetical protein
MSITNGYATLAQLKEALYEGTTQGTDADAKLERAIETASRKIETHCSRRFWADTSATARVFEADDPSELYVDDISTLTDLVVKTDSALDGTFSTTIDSSAIRAEPRNGLLNGVTWAYTELCLRSTSNAYFLVSDEPLIQVTARWGWPEIPGPIRDACIIQSVALLSAAKTPFGVAGLGDMGVMRVKSGLHPTAEELCSDYRRGAAIA